jgi:hypothetical protein
MKVNRLVEWKVGRIFNKIIEDVKSVTRKERGNCCLKLREDWKDQKEEEEKKKTRIVSQWGLAIYIKTYLKAKEEWWEFKYFTMQKFNLQKNPLKETKIL